MVKAEYLAQGPNTRLVVTNIRQRRAAQIYDGLYTPRGDMENRIKEQQLYLFADRTSCHKFIANQFRLMLASAAYVLVDHLCRTTLKGYGVGWCTSRNHPAQAVQGRCPDTDVRPPRGVPLLQQLSLSATAPPDRRPTGASGRTSSSSGSQVTH